MPPPAAAISASGFGAAAPCSSDDDVDLDLAGLDRVDHRLQAGPWCCPCRPRAPAPGAGPLPVPGRGDRGLHALRTARCSDFSGSPLMHRTGGRAVQAGLLAHGDGVVEGDDADLDVGRDRVQVGRRAALRASVIRAPFMLWLVSMASTVVRWTASVLAAAVRGGVDRRAADGHRDRAEVDRRVAGHGDQQLAPGRRGARSGRSWRRRRRARGRRAASARTSHAGEHRAGEPAERSAGHIDSGTNTRGSTVTLANAIFSRNFGRSPVALSVPEAAALGVEPGRVVEEEHVLEGDHVALHPLHLGDVGDPAGAVLESCLVDDQVDRGRQPARGSRASAGPCRPSSPSSRCGPGCRGARWSGPW